MQKSIVLAIASSVTLLVATLAMTSCLSCDRCTRKREARAAESERAASYPVPTPEAAAEPVAW